MVTPSMYYISLYVTENSKKLDIVCNPISKTYHEYNSLTYKHI